MGIASAQVALLPPEGRLARSKPLGRTDEHGHFVVLGPIDPFSWISILHADHAGPVRRCVTPGDLAAGRMTVELERPCRISGSIANWSLPLDDRGVCVIASPYLSPWVARTTRTGSGELSPPPDRRSHPDVRVAEVDANGDFVVRDCIPGVRYSLIVIGDAVIGDDRGPVVQAPAQGVALPAYFIHGARVLFTDAVGDPVVWDVRKLRSVYSMPASPQGGQVFFHAGEASRWIDQEALFQGPVTTSDSAAFGIALPAPGVEVLQEMSFQLPGERPRTALVRFSDLGAGDIAVNEIRTAVSNRESGSVVLRLLAQDGAARAFPVDADLYLFDSDEVATVHRVRLPAGVEDFAVAGVPAGIHSLHLQLRAPPLPLTEAEHGSVSLVSVEPGATATWEFALPALSRTEVLVREASGSPWFGPVSIRQRVTVGDGSRPPLDAFQSFDGPPFHVYAPPDASRHEVWTAGSHGRPEGERVTVAASNGSAGSVELTLPSVE